MKTKFLLINFSLVLFLTGLFFAVGGNLGTGAILVLIGAAILVGNYLFHVVQSLKRKSSKGHLLVLSTILPTLAIIFMHGFSVSIDRMLVYQVKAFTTLYFLAGFLLVILFYYFSVSTAPKDKNRKWLVFGTSLSSLLAIVGLLGFARIIPIPATPVFYSWVFLLFFYLILFLKMLLSKERESKSESLRLFLITIVFFGFWIMRFNIPDLLPDGLTKGIVHFGFVPLLILPIAILSVKKYYPYVIFIFHFILLDCYFIQFDTNFNHLVTIGVNGCEGYDQATELLVNTDPGIPIPELMKEPSSAELDEIILEWKEKDFSPKGIEIVHQEKTPQGDSIIIISHLVNGLKHYGAIRVPKGLDVQSAPILMELEGGGTGLDVAKISTLTQGNCRELKRNFISILPSYRGCIIRGDGFCFRSEGYFGDAWLGPAEDAVFFLEAVKKIYHQSDSTSVLVSGVSRGATVSLIIGGLTEKADYIIATSTHTKFLDEYVIKNEMVGNSFARAFFTPYAAPQEIRKRLIASSSYYFAANLPPFDLHQGGKDQRNTIWHANVLEDRLREIGRDSSTYNLFIYNDKGHGYDDNQIVCRSIAEFLRASKAKGSSKNQPN